MKAVLSSKVSRADLAGAVVWLLLTRLLYGAFILTLVLLIAAQGSAVFPRLFGYRTLAVQGGSMGESIANGSLVIARPLAPEDVHVKDVILVQEENTGAVTRPKLHRVVTVNRRGDRTTVETKGDSNATRDPTLYPLPDTVFTPAYTLPYVGHLVTFVATPIGWALLVALPGTGLTFLALRSIWTEEDQPFRNAPELR